MKYAFFQIFSSELEEVPEFQGFSTPIRNFCLYRGKQDDEDVATEERAVGYFKVSYHFSNSATSTYFTISLRRVYQG